MPRAGSAGADTIKIGDIQAAAPVQKREAGPYPMPPPPPLPPPPPAKDGVFSGMDKDKLQMILGLLAHAISPKSAGGRIGAVFGGMGAKNIAEKKAEQLRKQKQTEKENAERRKSQMAAPGKQLDFRIKKARLDKLLNSKNEVHDFEMVDGTLMEGMRSTDTGEFRPLNAASPAEIQAYEGKSANRTYRPGLKNIGGQWFYGDYEKGTSNFESQRPAFESEIEKTRKKPQKQPSAAELNRREKKAWEKISAISDKNDWYFDKDSGSVTVPLMKGQEINPEVAAQLRAMGFDVDDSKEITEDTGKWWLGPLDNSFSKTYYLTHSDSGPGQQSKQSPALPTVTTQEQYDSLSPGTIYLEEGEKYWKP